jgi:hypothetical protein
MQRAGQAAIVAVVVLLVGPAAERNGRSDEPADRTLTPHAWSLAEAEAQLMLNPHDVFLQYATGQLERAENGRKKDDDDGGLPRLVRVREEVDLFRIFSGALAVQESLQLEAMTAGEEWSKDRPRERTVDVDTLTGPTVQSHPWQEMLAGREPEVSPLSLCVPADQYLVLFRSLGKLLDVLDLNDRWGAHVIIQAQQEARNHRVNQRLQTQLALQSDPLTRPFYDLVVDEVAVTGSDLYVREGSDVTLLFQVKQPQAFKLRMDGFLDLFEQATPGAQRSAGEYAGVKYVHLTAPERRVHVFSAYPRENLHVRSNSLVGLKRALDAIHGRTPDGRSVERLGETDEFRYIRTLMPRGAQEEDGFVYMSDAFIRHLTGPRLKLAERRRMLAYNRMRMMGHAALLFRTQYGQAPKSLQDLIDGRCAPAHFADVRDPSGGKYTLSDDGRQGVSEMYGHPLNLVPCCEVPLTHVTEDEAEEYRQFVRSYEEYWQTYFDPIAIRIQVAPEQYRFETIVLPLINNSIYTGLAAALGGTPELLDELPVPEGNIFSMALKFDKKTLFGSVLKRYVGEDIWPVDINELDEIAKQETGPLVQGVDVPAGEAIRSLVVFLRDGIGNQAALHVYDTTPLFDFNLTGFVGEMMGSFNRSEDVVGEILPFIVLVTSLNSPVYVSVPCKDVEIVDDFLEKLDGFVAAMARRPARGLWIDISQDFYRAPLRDTDRRIRGYAVRFGPIKWRFFWARIGDGLYLASKASILDDLLKLHENPEIARGGAGSPTSAHPAHAMVRIRAKNWKQTVPHFELGWAESSRQAGLNNLSLLSNVARAQAAEASRQDTNRAGDADRSGEVLRLAEAIYGCHFFCPEGGRYVLGPDGQSMISTVHGSVLNPQQPRKPSADGPLGRALREFAGATAELSFLEDGLHAVLTIERKPE